MSDIEFEWDEDKADANRHKHEVSFEEASTVFLDDAALLISDPNHSHDEDRYLIVGRSLTLRVLVVSHCYRSQDRTIRIISARAATIRERRQYEGDRRL